MKQEFDYAKKELFVEAAQFLSDHESDFETWTNFKSSEVRERLTRKLQSALISAYIRGVGIGAEMNLETAEEIRTLKGRQSANA